MIEPFWTDSVNIFPFIIFEDPDSQGEVLYLMRNVSYLFKRPVSGAPGG